MKRSYTWISYTWTLYETGFALYYSAGKWTNAKDGFEGKRELWEHFSVAPHSLKSAYHRLVPSGLRVGESVVIDL